MLTWLNFTWLKLAWLNFALNVLRTFATFVNIFRKKKIPTEARETPFVVIPIEEVASKIASPLKVFPNRVDRTFEVKAEPGIYLLLGGAGVGKTREAVDLVKRIATLSGATTVYLANRYIDASVPLPARSNIRRVIVVVDDYDYGFVPAAAPSFNARQVGNSDAIANLKKLYHQIKASVDLHALIVTVNTHRLPISVSDVTQSLPELSITSMPAVNPTEFREFITSAAKALEIQISDEAMNVLVQNGDGRFDTVATFLNNFKRNSSIQKSDAENYATVRQAAWTLFRSNLSNEQQAVYDQVQNLKSFRLPARLEYIAGLMRATKHKRSLLEIQRIVESIWPVTNSQAIVYDGQIGPVKKNDLNPTLVARAILDSYAFKFKNRYAFQEEAKTFGCLWIRIRPQKEQIAFFKCMVKWYPYDRYFAYLLAESQTYEGHYYRAILTLYRVLNRLDVRIVYSGKWVEIQCHLLLAQLYQRIWTKKIYNWELQKKIEREFKLAINLAEIGRDLGPNDFETVYSSSTSQDADQKWEADHKELGFQMPPGASIDTKQLYGMVHHRYATFLVNQFHREYDTLKHEEIASQLIPGFGDALLYCAIACNQIGDNQKALIFINQARQTGPAIFDNTEFEFMLLHTEGDAMAGLGNEGEAKKKLQQCLGMARGGKHPDDAARVITLESRLNDENYWKGVVILRTLRRKSFAPNLHYEIRDPNFVLSFPPQWKIDKEAAVDVAGRFVIRSAFSSQISWDEPSKGPIDASVSVLCSNLAEEMCHDAHSLGHKFIEGASKMFQTTIEWRTDKTLTTTNKQVLWIMRFIAKQKWPKEGIVIVAALPTCRVQAMFLYEEIGAHVLREPIEILARDFVQQVQRKLAPVR